ncbi:tyrosine-protein kinase Fer [Eurytemora carolleeae]|uniref:tyrosine-protein kinase Fer n=1 Tax=Eurytemora carolleeae TaxID=1294199 RepID=UPI000C764941|nr:tyrosine-protein kinase Fer [Eurytemora carolleeae]|eukprot:XP_023340966.1 tyrosine-protein kinase Fer-like [Eurytemora affinis]
MGFSSSLQGETAHEALLARQDAELRLLENMKRCLALRIKCDREYAISLNTAILQAQKMDKVEMAGSLVAQSWSIFIDETEKLVKVVKENADQMASKTLETLGTLFVEKRMNRKMYSEEHTRICNDLHKLQENVQKLRLEYERCMDQYTGAKAKLEEQKSKGSKRLDEYKERYSKTSRKLHLVHNEYVLLLCEAAEFERDMRTILLPGLLEHQQAVQEDATDRWKMILQEVSRCTNLSSAKCQESQAKIEKSVNSIKSSEEYSEFIERNKTSPPKPIIFKFDPSLLENSGCKLKPNEISVDEYTVDVLRAKLRENEAELKETKNLIKEKQTLVIQYDTEFQTVQFKSDPLSFSRKFTLKKTMDILKKEINELRCIEQKVGRQNELISGSLTDLGCEQPACDISGSSNNLESLSPTSTEDTQSQSSIGKKKSAHVINILRKPFARKTESPNRATTSLPIELEEPEDVSPVPPVLAADTVSERSLEEELWFHGVLPREEVVRLLQNDGDFLVRETVRNDEKQTVLSVMWVSPKHFIVQLSPEGLFRFEGPAFNTIQELILHQYQSGSPVTSRSGAILKTPVLREKWELNNDDVELVEKIGRGNFGDVYKAILRPGNISVAVKTCKITLPDEQKKKFLQEGRILKQYEHPNIVRFIGICVQKQPIMIVMELVPGGSLLNYLRTNADKLSTKGLLGMCQDAASGMEYLESKNCIHRDLAARNCLELCWQYDPDDRPHFQEIHAAVDLLYSRLFRRSSGRSVTFDQKSLAGSIRNLRFQDSGAWFHTFKDRMTLRKPRGADRHAQGSQTNLHV